MIGGPKQTFCVQTYHTVQRVKSSPHTQGARVLLTRCLEDSATLEESVVQVNVRAAPLIYSQESIGGVHTVCCALNHNPENLKDQNFLHFLSTYEASWKNTNNCKNLKSNLNLWKLVSSELGPNEHESPSGIMSGGRLLSAIVKLSMDSIIADDSLVYHESDTETMRPRSSEKETSKSVDGHTARVTLVKVPIVLRICGEWHSSMSANGLRPTAGSPERDLNPDLPVLGSLAQHETIALANFTTDAENITEALILQAALNTSFFFLIYSLVTYLVGLSEMPPKRKKPPAKGAYCFYVEDYVQKIRDRGGRIEKQVAWREAGESFELSEMPPKRKKPPAKGAYCFYVEDYVQKIRDRGGRIEKQVAWREAGESFENLTPQERAVYDARAKEYKAKLRGNPETKYTTSGHTYAEIDREDAEKKEKQERIEREIEEQINKLKLTPTVENNFRVLPLMKLFYEMRNACSSSERFPKISLAEAELEKDVFAYTPKIGCEFHEKYDANIYCSLSLVRRWGFLIADHCCKFLNIPLKDGFHCPVRSAKTHSLDSRPSSVMSSISSNEKTSKNDLKPLVNSFKSWQIQNTPASPVRPPPLELRQPRRTAQEMSAALVAGTTAPSPSPQTEREFQRLPDSASSTALSFSPPSPYLLPRLTLPGPPSVPPRLTLPKHTRRPFSYPRVSDHDVSGIVTSTSYPRIPMRGVLKEGNSIAAAGRGDSRKIPKTLGYGRGFALNAEKD
uniref:HMG box domain-containing protein n=1 Tax=Timema bartmani TaxID=61472 RepID=A0A7R9ERA8_9NEOP|nr:unnamed protein product [Timema bartmani]